MLTLYNLGIYSHDDSLRTNPAWAHLWSIAGSAHDVEQGLGEVTDAQRGLAAGDHVPNGVNAPKPHVLEVVVNVASVLELEVALGGTWVVSRPEEVLEGHQEEEASGVLKAEGAVVGYASVVVEVARWQGQAWV